MPPFPSLTTKWHTTTYPSINPSRPELSVAGKTILITGGGTGIGASIARSFATAGCQKISLLGRRADPLHKTGQQLEADFPGLQVARYVADVTQKDQVDAAFLATAEKFGPVDILVSNAGYCTKAATIADLDPQDAWTAFETHVKGAFLVAQAFGRVASKEDAVVIETSSIVTIIPPFPSSSAYTASKLAASNIWAFFGAENPTIRVISYQPGQIDTDMAKKIGLTGVDDSSLPGNFVVWLASNEASFLDTKFVCANWDVNELIARKDEFLSTSLGKLKYEGF